MRLQLTVQRHSLPPVQVLWTVGVLRPPYAAAGTTATISQFLEQVNEIIPLESEDWGLEDYAVEVRGFECLHFSELSQTLKEDDEVCIRPLQAADLRFRKVSGRHQITADGRHLIDGVAFGRSFLRRSDRPAIRIPPRKRRRVTFDDDDRDLENHIDDRQLTIQSGLNGVNGTLADSDSENDEDFALDEGEMHDLTTELAEIYNDMPDSNVAATSTERTTNLDGVEEIPVRLTRSRQAKRGLGIQGASMLELVDENGRPYPGQYNNPLLDLFDNDEPPQSSQSEIAHSKMKPILNRSRRDGNAIHVYQENPEHLSRRSSSASMKSVRFEDADSPTPATIRDVENTDRSEVEDLESGNEVVLDLDESDKENSEPHFEAYEQSASPPNIADSSSSLSSELEYDDEITSSSSSSSDSDTSDSEPEQLPSTSGGQPRSSQSSSQLSSGSGRPFPKTKRHSENSNGAGAVAPNHYPQNVSSNNQKSVHTEGANVQQPQNSSLPFEGKHRTRTRNQRRRDSKKLNFLKITGVLRPNATILDYHKLYGGEESSDESQPEVADSDTDLQLRRDALLKSINSGVEDSFQNSSPRETSANVIVDSAPIDDQAARTEDLESALIVDQSTDMQGIEHDNNQEPINTSSAKDETTVTDEIAPEISKRRSKLDLATSRRLLFGSLGVRTPKSKEDEWNTRLKLMKDIRPVNEPKSPNNVDASGSFSDAEDVEDESWKNKIILKAVECCHDGIELSTPPFPFIQRWDPQQQKGYKGDHGWKAQKNKKRKRKGECFTQKVSKRKSEDGKSITYNLAPSGAEESLDESHVNRSASPQLLTVSPRESDEYEAAINDQLMRETASTSAAAENSTAEDLPILPENISTCTQLTEELCLPGAIVAFKQLDMSHETDWQPRVSEYRTALVNQLMENGILRMKLAHRDQPHIQKSYDHETGERIYSKFEMPGFNDEEDLEHGVAELSFAELIEPKLIRPASTHSMEIDDRQPSGCDGGLTDEVNVLKLERAEISPNLSTVTSSKLPNDPVGGNIADEGREGVRKEIFGLIKDAGWRSSIGSHLGEEKGSEAYLSPNDQIDKQVAEPPSTSSPNFLAFSSSPLTGRRTSIPPTEALASDPGSSPHSKVEIPESLPQRILDSQLPLKHSSSQGNEDFKPKNDEGLFISESQLNSDLSEANHQVSSQKLASQTSPDQSVIQSKNSHLQHESFKSLDGAFSDDEFPMIEDVFSQIRSSYDSSLEANEDSTYVASSSFRTTISKEEPVISPPARKVKPSGKENRPEKTTLFQWEEGDDQTTPRASQAPLQSQIVDLTLSSDPIDAVDSDYVDYGTQLPTGPGWVQKTRARVGRSETGQKVLGRSRQTRSTSYGPLN